MLTYYTDVLGNGDALQALCNVIADELTHILANEEIVAGPLFLSLPADKGQLMADILIFLVTSAIDGFKCGHGQKHKGKHNFYAEPYNDGVLNSLVISF